LLIDSGDIDGARVVTPNPCSEGLGVGVCSGERVGPPVWFSFNLDGGNVCIVAGDDDASWSRLYSDGRSVVVVPGTEVGPRVKN
jgi:hypothetical protein